MSSECIFNIFETELMSASLSSSLCTRCTNTAVQTLEPAFVLIYLLKQQEIQFIFLLGSGDSGGGDNRSKKESFVLRSEKKIFKLNMKRKFYLSELSSAARGRARGRGGGIGW